MKKGLNESTAVLSVEEAHREVLKEHVEGLKLLCDGGTYDDFVDALLIGKGSKDRFALALAEEVGELCGKLKRVHRGDVIASEGELKELGDVLFYLVAYAHECGKTLEDVIVLNVDKLTQRKQRKTIKGSGDER